MRRGPAGCHEAIVRPGGKLVLGREAVVDRHHDAADPGRQVAAHAVVRIEAAQHEAAAVKEHHERKRPAAGGRVDAQGNRPTRSVDAALVDLRDLGGRRHDGDARLVLPPRFGDRQRVRRRDAGPAVEQGLDLRIDGHDFRQQRG